MKALRSLVMAAGVLALPILTSGCINPLSMGIFTPVPMQPWVADRIEDRLKYKHDYRTPVLPPIPAGFRPLCEDPPDRAEILRHDLRNAHELVVQHVDLLEVLAREQDSRLDARGGRPRAGWRGNS